MSASDHGGDGRLVAASLGLDPASVLDLSLSMNPFAPDVAPLVVESVLRGALGRYPDEADRARATGALAAAMGVEPWRVLLTNGGAEAIALVAGAIGTGWVDEPDFSLYARHLRALVPGAPRFRSDPHNPSGLLADREDAAAVWDEAFYPLAAGRWSRRATGAAPAVVVGSLTKVFGCPGLRLGYVVVPADDGASIGLPGLGRRLSEAQPAWSVATTALEVLPVLIERADLPAWASELRSQRRALSEVLARHGIRARPSDANFVLVDQVPWLRDGLARRGVVVRDCTSFGLPGAVRIAVPDAGGLERLDRALDRVADEACTRPGAGDRR